MPHSQSWPLSQDVNKLSGECSICHATCQLHLKDGTVHKHGSRQNPCAGSGKLPLKVNPPDRPSTAAQNYIGTTGNTNLTPIVDPIPSSAPLLDSSSVTLPSSGLLSHPKLPGPIIKHILKLARPACCDRLEHILQGIASEPQDISMWRELFSFGQSVLAKPAQGGRRHNLTGIIKKRASAGSDQASESSQP